MVQVLIVSHVVSVVVALVVVTAIFRIVRKNAAKSHRPPRQTRLARLLARACRCAGAYVWCVTVVPIGWLIANHRYGYVAPVLQPFEQRLTSQHHRLGHAVCIPLPFQARWLLRCRGCHASVTLREVPALGGADIDLQVMRGTLDGATPCPACYLGTGPRISPIS